MDITKTPWKSFHLICALLLITPSARQISCNGEDGIDIPEKPRRQLRTMNVDTRFVKWSNKNQILFYLNANYTTKEQYLIRQAAWKVSSDLGGCVSFVETSASDNRYKIHVTPLTAQGTPEPYCNSYPGMVKSFATSQREQRHIIARGQYGCLDSLRGIMKYWAITLGRRNEHERGDRDLYITVNQPNLVLSDAYHLYSHSEAYWGAAPYDYCSVTHNRVWEFAKSGTAAFAFKNGPQATPILPQLSYIDCVLINANYGCDYSFCASFDCNAARQTALDTTTPVSQQQGLATDTVTSMPTTTTPTTTSTSTTPSTTTTTPTTTATTTTPTTTKITTTSTKATTSTSTTTTPTSTSTSMSTTTTPNPCPLSSFCNAVPDESSFLLGPYYPQTYVLYSGQCTVEYVMDWETSKFTIKSGPELIKTYLPDPGISTFNPPVTFAYMAKTPSDTYDLIMNDQAGSKALKCNLDEGVETNAAICPSAATSNGVIPTSTGTSASSMLHLGENDLAHYVVNSAQNEIKLMDESFKTTCQTTSNLLRGQSKIKTITAIQIIQDLLAVHTTQMAIFGIGSDDKPYMGFVDMPLNAECKVPLTTSWVAEPVALASAIAECDKFQKQPAPIRQTNQKGPNVKIRNGFGRPGFNKRRVQKPAKS